MPFNARADVMALDQVLNGGGSSDSGRKFSADATIVLVGCRGAGKKSLGFIGALHLRRRLIMEDHHFQQVTGLTRMQHLNKYGKEKFCRDNAEIFRQMLKDNRTRCIIECGMSSFSEDTQAALRDYCQTNPVIYIYREREEHLRILDSADGARLLSVDESHRTCSNLEFFNLYDGSHSPRAASTIGGSDAGLAAPSRLLRVKQDFAKFLDGITALGLAKLFIESPFAVRAIPPEFRKYSYALRLRLSYLVDMNLDWEDFEGRADCIELIIDHWPEDLLNIVARYVALIRRKLDLAIIYHVEESPRGERQRTPEEKSFMDTCLLEHGLRLNVDYLSIDLERSDIDFEHLIAQRGRSRIIGNFWNRRMGAPSWSSDFHLDNYAKAQALGCDIVRMTRFCSGDSTYEELIGFRHRLQNSIPDPKPPFIGFDFSILGARTPTQSRILSPVKHPHMDTGRDHLATVTTAATAFELLFRQKDLDPLHFYVLGANVSYSLSPYIHNAAYELTGMPHKFEALNCSTLEDLNRICVDPNFGGASLTAPFKVAIMPHLKLKSHHASVIGAVNVLIPLRGKSNFIRDHANSRNKAGFTSDFYGDNTDWTSICSCLRRNLSPRNHVRPSTSTGLVIGAGGQARAAVYAMIQLGCRNIFIYNRTIENAAVVADHFNNWAHQQKGLLARANDPTICRLLASTDDAWPEEFQQPTMIVSCVPATITGGSSPADFSMPPQWLQSPTGGVALELAYEPLVTPLVAQIQHYKETINPLWVVVDGLENLGEMAIEAFELMTGRLAPRRLMKETCRRTWQEQRRDGTTSSS